MHDNNTLPLVLPFCSSIFGVCTAGLIIYSHLLLCANILSTAIGGNDLGRRGLSAVFSNAALLLIFQLTGFFRPSSRLHEFWSGVANHFEP